MATGVRATADRHAKRGGASYSGEFLGRLARILVHSGHSPQDLIRQFRDICGRLPEPKRSWDPTQLGYFADLPHVLALWHADPKYLDSRGAPIALPPRGRAPSLYALIERVLPDEDPESVVGTLARLKGIRRRAGRYVPAGRHLSYRRNSGRVYALNALLGMLRTVERNISGPKSGAIFERAAMNPDFPVNALPAFHGRVKRQAEGFLSTVDGDMHRREIGNIGGPRIRLGVGVFVFEEPWTEARSGAKRRTSRALRARRRGRSQGGKG